VSFLLNETPGISLYISVLKSYTVLFHKIVAFLVRMNWGQATGSSSYVGDPWWPEMKQFHS